MNDAPNLVRDFCAVGDDSTDNTVAVNAFIEAAQACGVGYIPPGTFRHRGIYISQPLRLYGEGMYASKLRLIGDAVQNSISAVGSPGDGNRLIIENLGLLSPQTPRGGSAIAVIHNSRAIIRGCQIDDHFQGIYFSDSFATVVEGNYFTNMFTAAINYAADNSANGSSFNKNSVFACGVRGGCWAILVNGSYGVWTANENDIEGNAGGIRLANVAMPVMNGNWSERNGGDYLHGNVNGYYGPTNYAGRNYGF